jgi:hypothetical protein
VVNELLYAGADYDLADYEGKTPLSWAAEHGFVAIVGQLLAAGANINHIDISDKLRFILPHGVVGTSQLGSFCKRSLIQVYLQI